MIISTTSYYAKAVNLTAAPDYEWQSGAGALRASCSRPATLSKAPGYHSNALLEHHAFLI